MKNTITLTHKILAQFIRAIGHHIGNKLFYTKDNIAETGVIGLRRIKDRPQEYEIVFKDDVFINFKPGEKVPLERLHGYIGKRLMSCFMFISFYKTSNLDECYREFISDLANVKNTYLNSQQIKKINEIEDKFLELIISEKLLSSFQKINIKYLYSIIKKIDIPQYSIYNSIEYVVDLNELDKILQDENFENFAKKYAEFLDEIKLVIDKKE